MPIYEYHCEDCETIFEAIRPLNQADLPITCESCTSTHTSRVLSTFFSKSSKSISTYKTRSSCTGCSGGNCATCH